MRRLDDRTAGRIMQAVAAVGVVVALLGAIVGWNLIGRIDSAAGDTLELTTEALVTIDETIAVASAVVGSTVAALEAVESTLAELVTAADATQPLLASLADLGNEIAPNLESATETLRSLEDLGSTIDGVLGTLGRLPGTPSYDPDVPLSEQFGRLADDIEPLAETLRETSDQIGPTADSAAELQASVDELEASVRAVRLDLARSDRLLSEYAETAQSAGRVATTTQQGLSADVVAARLLVVLASLTFAAGQIVPYWFGRELLSRSDPERPTQTE